MQYVHIRMYIKIQTQYIKMYGDHILCMYVCTYVHTGRDTFAHYVHTVLYPQDTQYT